MTSAQKGRGVKKYPKFADKQFINLQTEGVQKLRKKVERHIWKPQSPLTSALHEIESGVSE